MTLGPVTKNALSFHLTSLIQPWSQRGGGLLDSTLSGRWGCWAMKDMLRLLDWSFFFILFFSTSSILFTFLSLMLVQM